jgi:hypothetical protein
MGAQAALVEQNHFAGVVGEASGVVKIARAQSRLPKKSLLALRRAINAVLRTGNDLRASVRDLLRDEHIDECPQEALCTMVANMTQQNTTLRGLLGRRSSLVAKRPLVGAYWSAHVHEKLLDLVDDLEDVCETLALGLSASFRQEVAAAAREAKLTIPGLDIPAAG